MGHSRYSIRDEQMDKVNKASATARLKEIKNGLNAADDVETQNIASLLRAWFSWPPSLSGLRPVEASC